MTRTDDTDIVTAVVEALEADEVSGPVALTGWTTTLMSAAEPADATEIESTFAYGD
jgi:hypothetical protein